MTWNSLARANQAFQASSETKSQAPRISTGAALAGHEGNVVALRAADADRNSPLIAKIMMTLRNALRGPAVPQADGDDANDAWGNWARAAGYRHQFGTFAQISAIAFQHLLKDGAVFVQRIQGQPDEWNPNGLSLLVRPWLNLDRSKGESGLAFSQGSHLAGVFFQQFQSAMSFGIQIEPQFVDLRHLIVMRLNYEADGVAGQPHTRASLAGDKILTEMTLADLQRARIAANMSAIGHTKDRPLSGNPFQPAESKVTGPNGEEINQLKPGSLPTWHGVDGIEFPRSDQPAVPYKAQSARVSTGSGLDVQLVGGDTGDASMSSLLHSTQMQIQVGENLARDGGVGVFFTRVLEWFNVAELLASRNWLAENWEYLPATPLMIDPRKVIESMTMETEAGFASRQGQVRKLGRDPRIVDRQREADTFRPATRTPVIAKEEEETDERHLALA